MLRELQVMAVIMCVSSYLEAGTLSIGTAVTQGDLRIDNYPVKVSGTIFDGSEIETGVSTQSTASVRLGNDIKIALYSNSSGTFYRDHLVLLRGEVDLIASPSFRTEVAGLVITASSPGSSGFISIGPGGAVNVLAGTGNLRVVKDGGSFLAQVSPNKPLAFSQAGDGGWRIGSPAPKDFRDNHRCYVDGDDDRDDRDCGGRHHRHPSN
jgi:hypothetical protein